jgi:hypothetical protein
MNLLEKINKAGTSIIMTTHNQELVDRYPHTHWQLEGGELIQGKKSETIISVNAFKAQLIKFLPPELVQKLAPLNPDEKEDLLNLTPSFLKNQLKFTDKEVSLLTANLKISRNMNLVWATTMKYIRRNPGLLASVVIITVTFSLIRVFVMNQFAAKAVTYLQSQPTLSVFYDSKEKEENIVAFKTFLEKKEGVLKVTYSTSADIQKQYLTSIGIAPEQQGQYTFDANQIRILRVQLKPGADYKPFLQMVDDEKNKGALIIDKVFFQDIVEKIRQFSNTVIAGSLGITVFLLIVSVVLVFLTIGFTINRFRKKSRSWIWLGQIRK